MNEQTTTIRIDGKDYALDQLAPEAKNLLRALRFADNEISRAEQLLAIFKTAKVAYGRALREELNKSQHN
jgi:hypothetical protein